MSDLRLGGLAFDRGIDRITHTSHGDGAVLPERSESPPSEAGVRPQLETLLIAPTIDSLLEAVLRPQLENRDLMVPTHFRQVLDQGLQQIRHRAEQLSGQASSPAEAGPGEQARILNRAARLLAEECTLRDLVQMYRSVLYQG